MVKWPFESGDLDENGEFGLNNEYANIRQNSEQKFKGFPFESGDFDRNGEFGENSEFGEHSPWC